MAIPGVTTTIKDRFYTVSRQDSPVGPRIVAIAKRSTVNGTGGVAGLVAAWCRAGDSRGFIFKGD